MTDERSRYVCLGMLLLYKSAINILPLRPTRRVNPFGRNSMSMRLSTLLMVPTYCFENPEGKALTWAQSKASATSRDILTAFVA